MFKDLVKQKRQMKGLTQQQLADLVSTSRQTIFNVEHGSNPTLDLMREIAKVLDIPEISSL